MDLRKRIFRRDRDGALSDIVGTSVVLAVTVVAVGAAAVSFGSLTPDSSSPPEIDIIANATASPSSTFISLRHAGGASLPEEELEVVVSSPSWTSAMRLPLNLTGNASSFDLGASGYAANASQPLLENDHVDVMVYLKKDGTLVASTSFVVASTTIGSAVALDGFLVSVLTPTGTVTKAGGDTLDVRASVVHPGGRKAIERVVINMSELRGPREDRLYDDGTHGDAIPGDGIYSASLLIPPEANATTYSLMVRAYDLDAHPDNSTSATGFTLVVTPSALTTINNLLQQFSNMTGVNGANGANGANGLNGGGTTTGLTGPQGPPGSAGAGGLTGANGTTGATGATGANGTAGTNGTTGATGATGANGTAGTNGTTGATGANGTAGANGTGITCCTGPLGITNMVPTSGVPGGIVTLSGFGIENMTSVLLAPQGATTAYLAAFAIDPSASPGAGLIFAIPSIPDGLYVVNATRIDGAWATAPTYLEVLQPDPEIDTLDPPQARAYTQVNVTGANFTYATSVTLENAVVGNVAVPWSVINDTDLVFVTHPGLAPGLYDVNVSTGTRWAIASLAFESLAPLAPGALTLTPSTVRAEDVVTITGTNLETVSRVTLSQTNLTRVIDTGWYFENGLIKVIVPLESAPTGPWDLVFHVDLTGTFSGVVRVPQQLTVQPAPFPTVTSFTPVRGEPFTQVNLFGSNFVNVKSVTFGETAVYFTPVGSHQILAVTHGGLAPGNYTINVTTATGSAVSSSTFEALPLKLVPIYNKSIFSYVGATLNASTGTNNDAVAGKLKFQLVNASWTVTGVTFNPVNYEPQAGSNPYAALTKTCGPTASRVQLWTLASTSLHAYLSPANELDFIWGVTVNMGGGKIATTYIFTNDETRNYILPAGQGTVTVLDHGEPTNGFANCN